MNIRSIIRTIVYISVMLTLAFIVMNRDEKLMKNKDIRKILKTVFVIFLVVWVVMFSVDVFRFKDWFKPPVFAKLVENDSNYYSYKYEGLFYQVYYGGTWSPDGELFSTAYGKITIGFDFLKSFAG